MRSAQQRFIYVSTHYPAALARIKEAVRQAHGYGLLGEKILGSAFGFDVVIDEGSGGYVCGEETALITTLEGPSGSLVRVPLPGAAGFVGPSTVVNNLETLAMVQPLSPGRQMVQQHRQQGQCRHQGHFRKRQRQQACLVEVPLRSPSRILSQSAAA